jgi:hypothetical protein
VLADDYFALILPVAGTRSAADALPGTLTDEISAICGRVCDGSSGARITGGGRT